ncbi:MULTISPECIES: hypothetical protein [Thioalkalivibrio]|uniref:Uncharacterized protein n=1 Tax=Thioalkalivibrio halophilus TaxID=252474 RepID=A0A1V2ZW21_9GAMM|nr:MULTISPECIES: hypothetical protein [Thioalkalivibrio]OOC09023.1 hypothetical protein B1A74_13120 [Thioalkalivibrio halophilus]PYG00026.1 hypothetical protein D893_02485 [Thioalkalivibrio sp. ALE21]
MNRCSLLMPAILACGLFPAWGASSAVAEELADPTRLPAVLTAPEPAAVPDPAPDAAEAREEPDTRLAELRVIMVRLQGDRNVARVQDPDGRESEVHIGDTVDRAEILHIEPRGIVVRTTDGEEHRLSVTPPVEMELRRHP